MYKMDYGFLFYEIRVALAYLPYTFLLALVPMVVGMAVGSALAMLRIQRVPGVTLLIRVYVVLVRGLPQVLTMLILYFVLAYGFDALMQTLGIPFGYAQIPRTVLAMFVLSFVAIAFLSESIRAALQSVPPGQVEAAESVGMTTGDVYRRVVIPQALPVAIPILGNTFIAQVKGTALVYMIGVTDLMTKVKIEANASYRYLEAYIACSLVYWVICVGIERLVALAAARVNSAWKEVA